MRSFEWAGAEETADAIRAWSQASTPAVDVTEIEREVRAGGDEALLRLTNRFDATDAPIDALRVDAGEASAASGSTNRSSHASPSRTRT